MSIFDRDCGVLLHPTSLPGPYCIGDIGFDALRWLHVLHQMGQSLWQILPLNPSGLGDSPYQSPSAFAGDTRLLSPEVLCQWGLLERSELAAFPECDARRVAFDIVESTKLPLLQLAAARLVGSSGPRSEAFEEYCQLNSSWLDAHACFTLLTQVMPTRPWSSWPEPLARRDPTALDELRRQHHGQLAVIKALQYLFDEQWKEVRRTAHELGVRILGDLPIFVAYDSADVWCNPGLFKLDADGAPTVVAGVPPDYFSATGQRWGNPVYDWEAHRAEGYRWWLDRLKRALDHADVVRVDHFRGFCAHWEIPSSEPTAVAGQWVAGPGDSIFEAIQRELGPEMPIVAEDLGLITEDVVALKDRFQLPGMRVLQFSFGGRLEDQPDRYPKLTVAYTGTHDNDTILGWYHQDTRGKAAEEQAAMLAERQRFAQFFQIDPNGDARAESALNWTCIRGLMHTDAAAVVVPVQDILGQGSESRMNEPGTVGAHNWGYRFVWEELTPDLVDRMLEATRQSRRGRFRG